MQINNAANRLPVRESANVTVRDSNLELYRIIVMLAIIAHHYVVNSGITTVMYTYPRSSSATFLYLFGAWGKTGINCFVLISGYFMCKSKISLKKFVKLLLELQFYRILFSTIFWITGFEKVTVSGIRRLILPVTSVSSGFPGCFLLFYLLIPFLNILIKNLSEKMHLLLVILTLGIYTGIGSLSFGSVTMNYVSWFCVLYLVASYVRLYPKTIYSNTLFWGLATLASVGISVYSIYARRNLVSVTEMYFYLADSNKVLAFTNGLTSFMFFKNIKIKPSRLINTLGASTFGVLLIHANSDSMRKWLWIYFLKNSQQFGSSKLLVHAICSVIGIFLVCSLIDGLRIKFLEKPFFLFWDRHWDRFLSSYRRIESKVLTKLNIKE